MDIFRPLNERVQLTTDQRQLLKKTKGTQFKKYPQKVEHFFITYFDASQDLYKTSVFNNTTRLLFKLLEFAE